MSMRVNEWKASSSENALKTGSENKTVKLTRSDWAEILAILGQTLEAIKTGDFGEDEDHSTWVSQPGACRTQGIVTREVGDEPKYSRI